MSSLVAQPDQCPLCTRAPLPSPPLILLSHSHSPINQPTSPNTSPRTGLHAHASYVGAHVRTNASTNACAHLCASVSTQVCTHAFTHFRKQHSLAQKHAEFRLVTTVELVNSGLFQYYNCHGSMIASRISGAP